MRVCIGLNLLSNSLWLSRMTSSYLSCNSCCNSLLPRITKQSNGPDIWCLVATSLAIKKISVATQLATQLHESRCKSNGLEFYWAISYFSVYWEIAKPIICTARKGWSHSSKGLFATVLESFHRCLGWSWASLAALPVEDGGGDAPE
jgi:hypothetical protein